MDNTLIIKVGKRYVTRNGLTTEPLIKSNNGTKYIFESKINEPEYTTPSVCVWLGNGRFLSSEQIHRLDLISEK